MQKRMIALLLTVLLAALLLCGCGETDKPLSPGAGDDILLTGLTKYAQDEKGEYTVKVSSSVFNSTAKGGFVRTDKDALPVHPEDLLLIGRVIVYIGDKAMTEICVCDELGVAVIIPF